MAARIPSPLRITAAYAVASTAWIVGTDLLIRWSHPAPWAALEVFKGLLFVGGTSALLYRWARCCERHQQTTAEAAARASEERYRLVAENSNDVIWIMSLDARLQYVSPSIERLVGHPPARVVEMSLEELLTPTSLELARKELEAAREEIRSCGHMTSRLLEMEVLRADGSTVWTEVSTVDFHDGSGRVTAMLGVLRDITRRRATEEALANEVARCRALLDVSADGIHLVSEDGRLLEANDAFLRQLGYTRDELSELRITDWNSTIPDAELRRHLADLGPAPFRLETKHRRKDGSVFDVEIVTLAVRMHGRRVFCASARDITERKDFEHRLLRAQRLESIGLLASGIAHDLNNVLTPILLSTGLLEMKYPTPDDRALLTPIEAAARRGSNIVQQILTFARGAEGQRICVEPKILVKELSQLIRETFPRNIAHRLDIAADAWAITGDPTQLHQVLLNLAVNARDAMPEGGALNISIRNREIDEDSARSMPSARAGRYVCIEVSDTGTGMSREVQDHLFEPFFTTKPRGRGTGLGLSTVHGLVRGHGGFVEVTSKLGHGSQFRVFLPASTGPVPVPSAIVRSDRPRLGRGQHVLVIDDEPAILTVATALLERHGFVPLPACDGNEALDLLQRHRSRIAVVITDVMMPKFDGVRVASVVRERYPGVPVIAMSGMIAPTAEDNSRRQLLELGVTVILDKPYSEADLLRAIESALPGEPAEAHQPR